MHMHFVIFWKHITAQPGVQKGIRYDREMREVPFVVKLNRAGSRNLWLAGA